MFEPVTNSLNDLKDIQKTAATATAATAPSQSRMINVKDHHLLDEAIDDAASLPPPMLPVLLSDEMKPGAVYLQTLDSVPLRSLDDGVLA